MALHIVMVKIMDRIKQLRRTALLCSSFVRNYAYYKAGWDDGASMAKEDFWITVQSNFLDVAALEWTKLFGNSREAHHWKKVVADYDSFKNDMIKSCDLTDDDFSDCHKMIKEYRNKFVAHLDSDKVMKIPMFNNALKLTQYYYDYVLTELPTVDREGFPLNIVRYYEECFKESTKYFGLNK